MKNDKTYWVLVELRNCSPFVVRISSKTKKSPPILAEIMEEQYDLDWEEDSVSILDKPVELSID